MKNTRQYWFVGFVIVLMIFLWGLVTWMDAYNTPVDAPVKDPEVDKPVEVQTRSHPMSRYAKLMDGSLFWGIYPVVTPPVVFHSTLTLWGTIKGSTAIVSLDPSSNEHTQLVGVGDEYGGEKILEIGNDYIKVRNSSGEGQVKM